MIEKIFTGILISIFVLIKLTYRRNQTTRFGAPFVPLEPDVVERVLNLTGVKKGDIFYDLGSGDGRLVIAAALRGAVAYGIEIDPIRAIYSKIWIFLFRLRGQATIIQKNIFDVDLSKADVITAYLLQETNNLLVEKLSREGKPGARIMGIAFYFPGWKPSAIDHRGPIYGPLYLYQIPKKKARK